MWKSSPSILAALLLVTAARVVAVDSGTVPPPPSAEQRYEQGRRLMQSGRYLDAAEVFSGVADSTDAPASLRAQALFTAGLMQEDARNYERAVEIYQDVGRRFPGAAFAWQATQALNALNAGGPGGIEFRRREDEAWDVLLPAEDVADREGLGAARPALEHAAALLQALLHDFADHPKARDVAIALGNVHMTLRQFADAGSDFERALALAQAQSQPSDHGDRGADSVVMDAEARLAEAIRAGRRQWITLAAQVTLAAIVLGVLALRPWREVDRAWLQLGTNLLLVALALGVVASVASYAVRHLVDEHSTIADGAAGLLVAVPGATGLLIVFGAMNGLRATGRWRGRDAAGVAAALGAIAALAVAVCLIDVFALFPTLDSKL